MLHRGQVHIMGGGACKVAVKVHACVFSRVIIQVFTQLSFMMWYRCLIGSFKSLANWTNAPTN